VTIWSLIPLITCLTYIVLLVLTLPSIERRINRVFACYLAIAAAWSFTSFMLHLNAFPQQALFWNEVLVVALIWTSIAYYHFIRAYNNKPGGIGLYLGYGFLLVLAVLCLSGYIVQYSYVIDGVLYHSLGNSIYFIGAISLFIAGAVIFQLIKRYRSSTDPAGRNRTVYLMTGWGILVASAYTNLIPAVAGLPVDHVGSLINVLIISYAISRFHLLDVRFVARRGLAYLLVIICLVGIYIGAILLGHRFFPDRPLYTVLLLTSGLVLLLALVARPLRYVIQEKVDRFFYRETYDYRQILFTFSDKISNVLDLGELAQSILDPIVKAMHIKQAALLLPEIESGDFNTQFIQRAAPKEPLTKLRFTSDSPIVTWLATEGKVLRLELIEIIPQFKGLWETERVAFKAAEVELFCPIMSKGNLIGIMAVGKKQSDSPYSEEEVGLFMTMANQVAVAIENARMLDSLKNERLRVRRLLAQTVHAQEEERKRISIDLHDSVAQWLIGASYRAQTCSELLSGRDNGEAQGELAAMESTIDKSLKELRRVLTGLRPPALDELGLVHALRQSLEDLRTDGIDCQFSEADTPVRLPSSIEIAVYRIVQEALANVRKHAKATKVNLHLRFQTGRLLVEVHDNGRGFDLSQTLDSAISVGHMGLLGMKERVEALGGDIRIKTGEGAGTAIILSLPVQSQMEER